MSTPEERQKKARFAAYEIIDTEKTYLSRLRGVYDVYVIPLMKSRLLDDNDFDLQFGCWNTIFDVSERFYNSLQALRSQENPQLGKFFTAFVEVSNPISFTYFDFILFLICISFIFHYRIIGQRFQYLQEVFGAF